MKESLQSYRKVFESKLEEFLKKETTIKESLPAGSMSSLIDPVIYIMSNGGKRIRPVLLLISNNIFGGKTEEAMDAAIAIEILHNFTLVHDDIMDNASTRRGRETIHKKWDVNTAILVGDDLIGLSYRALLNTNTRRIADVIKTFSDGVIEVCEGQALDKEFEESNQVSIFDYLIMIRKKTAELLKTSAAIGALIGGAGDSDLQAIKDYAENIGLAFQIHDDLLDVTGNESRFGKMIGGDIIEKKKTYLYLKAMEILNFEQKQNFMQLFESAKKVTDRIKEVKKIYEDNCILESARTEIKDYFEKAKYAIGLMNIGDKREILYDFSDMLLNRKY